MTNELPLVAICVATYKRPAYLSDLLESIGKVKIDRFRACLLVADNDSHRSAQDAVESSTVSHSITVSYIVEPKRGVASARNALVREASRLGADYVAFIDDDQIVDPGWLSALVRVARCTHADAVVGRYVFVYDDDVPAWAQKVSAGSSVRTTGSALRLFNTGNVLIKTTSMTQIPGPFDERQNLTGGEDAIFSERYYLMGYKAVACAESVVFERVSKEKATVQWRLRRGFRSGVNLAQVAIWVEPSLQRILARACRSFGYMCLNSLLLFTDVLKGRAAIVARCYRIAVGFGGVVGILLNGRSFQEYRKIYGN